MPAQFVSIAHSKQTVYHNVCLLWFYCLYGKTNYISYGGGGGKLVWIEAPQLQRVSRFHVFCVYTSYYT